MLISDIKAENDRRRIKLLNPDYNQWTGKGSPIPRKLLQFGHLGKEYDIYVPEAQWELTFCKLLQTTHSTTIAGSKIGMSAENVIKAFNIERKSVDFEYWAIAEAKITPKEGNEKGKGVIPFKLNNPQIKTLGVLMGCFLRREPIRVIIVKARQWGGSTLVQLFMQWLQLYVLESWHSVIVGNEEYQAQNVRAMYSRVIRNMPEKRFKMHPFERSTKDLIVDERGCVISIGSMQKPEGLRSKDIMMAHMSELASWRKTKGKDPLDLVATIMGTVPMIHGSLIVKESTAKGVGNYFHKAWLAANSTNPIEKSADVPVFVGWHEIEIYQKDLEEDVEKFWAEMSAYEHFLWKEGATLEGINWYRQKLKEFEGNKWRMAAEYPTTAQESFQSTGERIFSPALVENARKNNAKPMYSGELFADGDTGVDALLNLEFTHFNDGRLLVWDMPDEETANLTDRYIVIVDIGGTTDRADYSVISVLDRYWIAYGGALQRVAVWRGHLEQYMVAWKAVQIAEWYHNALLVIERNSLKIQQEGDHFLTVLNEIVEFYDNIYAYTAIEKIKEGVPTSWGFSTNKATKPLVISTLKRALASGEYVEYYEELCNEMDSYERKTDGSMGASDGEHDDVIMSTAIGVYIAMDTGIPLPEEKRDKKRRTRYTTLTEASI